MRCKKHPCDLSNSVGVCASCLRERLFSLIAAQAQISSLAHSRTFVGALEDHHRKFDPKPPSLVFPRSVSPYVSHRKSDHTTWQDSKHQRRPRPLQFRFSSTPQVGPTYTATSSVGSCMIKKHNSKFSLLSNLFQSRLDHVHSDPRISTRVSSSSWLSKILTGDRKDSQSRQCNYPKESTISRNSRRRADRGMSPDCDCESVEGERSPSGSGHSSESSEGKQKTVTVPPSSERQSRGRNVSAVAFCLSPLVRASPNRHWNQKSFPPDIGFPGEGNVSLNPHISTAASYCANRSRKLADFRRAIHNR